MSEVLFEFSDPVTRDEPSPAARQAVRAALRNRCWLHLLTSFFGFTPSQRLRHAQDEASPAGTPRYEPADCRFRMTECEYRVRWPGRLVVPEDRTQPDSRMIRLHAVVNPSPVTLLNLIRWSL